MAITISTAMCDTFKQEVLMAVHKFATSGGHTFKMALFCGLAGATGTFGAGTTNYSDMTGATAETSDTSGNAQYTAGGFTMATNANPALDTTNHVAYVDWLTDPNWGPAATILSCGALLYNTSATNSAVGVFAFGADKQSTTGTFTVTLPAPAYNTALLRLA